MDRDFDADGGERPGAADGTRGAAAGEWTQAGGGVCAARLRGKDGEAEAVSRQGGAAGFLGDVVHGMQAGDSVVRRIPAEIRDQEVRSGGRIAGRRRMGGAAAV